MFRFPLASIVAVLCLALTPPAGAAENTLRVLAWPGYADADVVQAFEARFHAKVDVTIVDSDEALWDDMHMGSAPRFDVLAANTAEIQRYTREHLLAPLELGSLPNTRGQMPRFRRLAEIQGLVTDGQVYGIPYTYSTMGLIYDRKQIAQPPHSMAELWNPQYQGKVLAYNSAQQNFSYMALTLGYRDPFKLSPAELTTIARKLVVTRRNLLTYYSLPEEATALFMQHKVALMFANYGTQQLEMLRRAGADVGYAIPDEGVLAWLDCWAMTRSASNPALAQAWINYMLQPDVSQLLSQRQGLANTVSTPPGGNERNRIYWIEPVEDIRQRELLWSKIVSGDRPENF